MKIVLVLCVVLVFTAATIGQPIDLEEIDELTRDPQPGNARVKRFTCDVLSIEARGIKLNDSACGVHCLLRGRTGGYCNGQRVCICR